MIFQNTLEFAQQLDAADPLAKYRREFHYPQLRGKEVIYLAGNSLGLQPKRTQKFVDEVMEDWRVLAVDGHFYAKKPWWDYHERLAEGLSHIVGAHPKEVSVMNTLTVNLHLLMVSFYRPTAQRFKILCEEKAFPSDQYMLQSQVRFHGFNPKAAIVPVKKQKGAHVWRTEDFLQKIHEVGEDLALVFLGGVNYYNGQVLDMEAITAAGKAVGAFVGWDLAHAVGNVPLQLHDWGVDFAAWCSYKYMNSGPGNASGIFVNEKHLDQKDMPRFEGWWGTQKEKRFLMEPEFAPIASADAWQVSNPPVLSLAPYLASLELFEEVGMEALVEKQQKMVAYLEYILWDIDTPAKSTFEIITPKERGCQLSILCHKGGRALFEYLLKNGVVLDWREPNVMRLAPVPLYCSYTDIYTFGQLIKEGLLHSRNIQE